MAGQGPRNGRQGFKRSLPLGYWALRTNKIWEKSELAWIKKPI